MLMSLTRGDTHVLHPIQLEIRAKVTVLMYLVRQLGWLLEKKILISGKKKKTQTDNHIGICRLLIIARFKLPGYD